MNGKEFLLRRSLNETFTSLDALTTLGRPTKSLSDILVHMLDNNMDKITRLEWKKNLGRTTVVLTVDRVKTFLQGQALLYESIERTTSSSISPTTVNRKINDSCIPGSRKKTLFNKSKSVYAMAVSPIDSTSSSPFPGSCYN